MNISELRPKNKQELAVMLDEKLAKLADLRFDLAGGKLKNLKEVQQIKLDIARIKTLQNEKQE